MKLELERKADDIAEYVVLIEGLHKKLSGSDKLLKEHTKLSTLTLGEKGWDCKRTLENNAALNFQSFLWSEMVLQVTVSSEGRTYAAFLQSNKDDVKHDLFLFRCSIFNGETWKMHVFSCFCFFAT
ncbi:hypothetical protein RND81_05G046200 [Saponaria officinalis]|uniref:Uncharacterized protein n=1 Tax=Saponaria officinalis TaxID=3572 RepID=A0AAW1KUL2_SAPOF